MLHDLNHLEGKKFCVVFVKVIDESAGKVELQALHGRASIEAEKLRCYTPEGVCFAVPNSALPNILPNDGTELLKDAEYFVLVKLDPNIEFMGQS
ncbi:MAG: hypothetical protein K9N51_10465 [Candidatus Pacebacteria bacterium]|nr:hypothetical protein [Candidatus Paceibacterota bacterium]